MIGLGFFPLKSALVKCVYWKVSTCLKCVFTSWTTFSLNLVPMYTTVSKNIMSVSDISAVNSSSRVM